MNRRRTKPHADPAAQTGTLSWLRQDGLGSSLLATVAQLTELQRAVAEVLPEPIRSACRVLRFEDGRMTLGVPAATHSAKLRQLAPRIAMALEKRGWQINGIAVRVQATLTRPGGRNSSGSGPVRDPAAPMGPRGIEAFGVLRRDLRDGPLANAVARLLQRRDEADED